MSSRDRGMAVRMLQNLHDNPRADDQGLRRALQVMLMLNLKVEIEFMHGFETGLIGWILKKLNTAARV